MENKTNFTEDENMQFTCCICHEICSGYGNNPQPLIMKRGSRCCDRCNKVVQTARDIPTELDPRKERVMNEIINKKKNDKERLIAKVKFIIEQLINHNLENCGDDTLGVAIRLKDSGLTVQMMCSFHDDHVSFNVVVDGCDGTIMDKYAALYPGIDFLKIYRRGLWLWLETKTDLDEFKTDEYVLFRAVGFVLQVIVYIHEDTLEIEFRKRMKKLKERKEKQNNNLKD